MLSRLAYTFRETWASFRRNMTLTVAAIITSAVSLLIFGLTLLMQQGFDNLLVQWEGDVEMIVYVNAGASDDQRAEITNALSAQSQLVEDYNVLPRPTARSPRPSTLLAGDPGTLELLDEDNIPTHVQGGADRRHRRGHAAPAARQPARACPTCRASSSPTSSST